MAARPQSRLFARLRSLGSILSLGASLKQTWPDLHVRKPLWQHDG